MSFKIHQLLAGSHKGVGSAGPQVVSIGAEEFGLLAKSRYRDVTCAQWGQQKLLPLSCQVPGPSAEGHSSHTRAALVYSPSDEHIQQWFILVPESLSDIPPVAADMENHTIVFFSSGIVEFVLLCAAHGRKRYMNPSSYCELCCTCSDLHSHPCLLLSRSFLPSLGKNQQTPTSIFLVRVIAGLLFSSLATQTETAPSVSSLQARTLYVVSREQKYFLCEGVRKGLSSEVRALCNWSFQTGVE